MREGFTGARSARTRPRTRNPGCASRVLCLQSCARIALVLLLPAALFAVGACVGPAGVQHERGVLILHGVPEDAQLRVDDRVLPVSLAVDGIGLPAGQRRVEVVAEGYLPWLQEVRVIGGAVQELHVELWPRFDELDRESAPPPQRTPVPDQRPLPRR